jgi:septum site-determining protein MinC
MRGRSIMALVLTPEPPTLAWLASLDTQIERSPNFFEGRPVIVDVGALPRETPDVAGLLHAIAARGIHIIGTEGAHPSWPGLEPWGRPMLGAGKPGRPIEISEPAAPNAAPAVPAPASVSPVPAPANAGSLLIDHPVRSGQSVHFGTGDLIVLGSVASGAEVVAGGSIHVYGALRGRAVAGLSGNSQAGNTRPGNSRARIFCRKFHAELVAIDGVYQTADNAPPERIGGPACAWLDGDIMRITAID